jgi:hypothetical protein
VDAPPLIGTPTGPRRPRILRLLQDLRAGSDELGGGVA